MDSPLADAATAQPVTTDAAEPRASQKPLRVLLFDHTAELGGGEIAMADLVRRFDRSRVEPIALLASRGPLEDLLEGHLPVHRLLLDDNVVHARREALGGASLGTVKAGLSMLRYIGRLMRFLDEQQIEIIHTNSLKASVLGGVAGRLKGRKVIWHIRDRIADDYLPHKVVVVMRRLARVLPQFVIGNSRATLATLDLPGTPTAAIPSGVDLSRFFASDAAVPAMLAAAAEHDAASPESGAAPLIGLVGRICPWKGQHVFLKAAALVHARFPQARFQIIGAALFGEQAYEQELYALVADNGLADSVEFLGFQKNVPPLIRALDILVHASVVGEPFGQVIVQGMACGKPVVATNGGGVPETVVDGDTGLLVPMGDAVAMAAAVEQLLGDPAAAAEMGERGRERVIEKFTIEQSARRVTEVYEYVAGRRADVS